MSIKWFVAFLSLCLLASCQFWDQRSIEAVNGRPFTIQLHGSQQVDWVTFHGPYQNANRPGPEIPKLDDPKKIILWQIRPPLYVPMDTVPPITYGQLPAGWKQDIPKDGSPPPQLTEGYVYYVGVVLAKSAARDICFYLADGKAEPYVEENVKSNCGTER